MNQYWTALAIIVLGGCGGSIDAGVETALLSDSSADSSAYATGEQADDGPLANASRAASTIPIGNAGAAAPDPTSAADVDVEDTSAADDVDVEDTTAGDEQQAQDANPTDAETVSPSGGVAAGQPGELYDLGTLPDGFQIRWPELPVITHDVNVDTIEEFRTAASTAGTRIHVTGTLAGSASIEASDVEVVMDEGAGIGSLTVAIKTKRIRVLGGSFGTVTVSQPSVWSPSEVHNPEWIVEDVTLDGLTIDADVSGLFPSAHRFALVRSYIHASEYSIFSDMIDGSQNTDFIIAGNVFESEGVQATLRFFNLNRAVIVDNDITSLDAGTVKHNYRIHGVSDQVFAARNVLVNAGVMIGTMDGDDVGQTWFNANTFYHQTPDLFNIDTTRVKTLHAHDNVVYTKLLDPGDAPNCFGCGAAAWDLENNQEFPYQAPPAN